MSLTALEHHWFAEDPASLSREQATAGRAAQQLSAAGPRPVTPIARRLLQAVRNPFYETADIVRLIELDPALAARVLRIVNSAAYALVVRVASLPHAVTLLGAQAIADLALAASLLDIFDDQDGTTARIREHSTLVASLARYMAMYCSLPTDAVYTCGLLHDVGKLLLLQSQSEWTLPSSTVTAAERDAAAFEERNRNGFDHAILGGCSLKHWGVPDPIPTVVSLHHRPTCTSSKSPLVSRLVGLVRFADRLSYELTAQQSADADHVERLSTDESASFLGIDARDLTAIWDDLQLIAMDTERRLAPPFKMRSLRARSDLQQRPVFASCAICDTQTEGDTCLRCDSPLCSEHAPSEGYRCALCEAEYGQEQTIRSRDGGHIWRTWAAAVLGVGALAIGAQLVPLLAPIALIGGIGIIPLLLAPLATRWREHRYRRAFLRAELTAPPLDVPLPPATVADPIATSCSASTAVDQPPEAPSPEARPKGRRRTKTIPLAIIASTAASSSRESNRRATTRLHYRAAVKFEGDKASGAGVLRDIGAGGVRIRTEHPPPPVGTDLLVAFRPPTGVTPIQVKGRVVWCAEAGSKASVQNDFGVSAQSEALRRSYEAVLTATLTRRHMRN